MVMNRRHALSWLTIPIISFFIPKTNAQPKSKKWIEYKNKKTGELKTHPVSAFFFYAPIYLPPKEELRGKMTGVNVGIALPHKNFKEAQQFLEEGYVFSKEKAWPGLIFVCGRDFRVPVFISDGNCYEPKMGTSCLFGYIAPELPIFDEAPKLG